MSKNNQPVLEDKNFGAFYSRLSYERDDDCINTYKDIFEFEVKVEIYFERCDPIASEFAFTSHYPVVTKTNLPSDRRREHDVVMEVFQDRFDIPFVPGRNPVPRKHGRCI